jgi:uncharacterized membrane protein (UPF0127 family)
MKKIYIISAGIFFVLLIVAIFHFTSYSAPIQQVQNNQEQKSKKLLLTNKTYTVEVADSDPVREKGLSDRESLPQDHVLLFVFQSSGYWGFWMKDMKFSIDMIWLDENYNIVFYKENVSPKTYPSIYVPTAAAKYVVEANAGFMKENALTTGTKLIIQ